MHELSVVVHTCTLTIPPSKKKKSNSPSRLQTPSHEFEIFGILDMTHLRSCPCTNCNFVQLIKGLFNQLN